MSHPLENAQLSAQIGKAQRLVVIVRYRADQQYWGVYPPPANPNVLHQITVLGSKLSRCGRFIRLGDISGDELSGWQRRDSLEVVCVLGELAEDGQTVKAA